MDDIFAGLLPFLPGIPFGLYSVIITRQWMAAIKELRVERLDHRKTQIELDVERGSRRKIEDVADGLTRLNTGLEAEVNRLRKQLGGVL